MATDNVSRIDAEMVDTIAASWIRKIRNSHSPCEHDSVFEASACAVSDDVVSNVSPPSAFAFGTEFGLRLAAAVIANPLYAADQVRAEVDRVYNRVRSDGERERMERELFSNRVGNKEALA
jgi:hypothetical protein